MQLPTDDLFSFGASTRQWMLRERPNMTGNVADPALNETSEHETSVNVSLLGLPEAEAELNVSQQQQPQTLY